MSDTRNEGDAAPAPAPSKRSGFPRRRRAARRLAGSALLLSGLLSAGTAADDGAADPRRIAPSAEHPRYWQYEGEPVMLLGGSDEDNLFQVADLAAQLRLLASVGGNYVRNVMSARDPGNVQPFARLPDGRYDLGRWNDEYWERFEQLLRRARTHDIIVQVEVWDRFDYSRAQWEDQPFNPKNNVNYSYEASGFAARYPGHPGENRQPFFYTTPAQRDNEIVFRYQRRFVDELLRRSLPYPNVLYCIDNETSGDPAWSAFWADYIQSRAQAAGVEVYVTEMWDDWDLRSREHRATLDQPQRYGFVDVSQNNHQRGDAHWDNLQWVRRYIAGTPRPINAVKTYGAGLPADAPWWRRIFAGQEVGPFGSARDGVERFWRQLIGGAAAVRFHRPPSGLGLNPMAQRHLRSARLLLQEFAIVRATPDAKHERLTGREPDEAYLTAIEGEAYAVYFPDGGDVRLSLPADRGFTLRWLAIDESRWGAEAKARGGTLRLAPPGDGHWLALLTARRLPGRKEEKEGRKGSE